MQVLRKAFNQQLDGQISDFVNSVEADSALISVDIQGSIAHATMLTSVGLLTEAQGNNIICGLNEILTEAEGGNFALNPAFEDVHMNVEKRLEAKIGQDALRLHTARSRNDQVALDMRLFVLNQIKAIQTMLRSLQGALNNCAAKNKDVVMPGYTHLQRAQPILFAHAMHAFAAMLDRDYERFTDAIKRTAISPLGAGAQAGTALPIDPAVSAAHLALPALFSNSIDAVSDRDFVAEFIFAASLSAVHLSQLAETLIIWASQEFNFVTFSDNVTTASSLMPQKKNPDPIELVRGKTGGFIGELINVLTTLKGLPLGYNRDLQETKPPAIKVAKDLLAALAVMEVVLANLTVNVTKMEEAASDPDMITTDLVEYLVLKGVPFRQAHEQISALAAYSKNCGQKINRLTLDQLKEYGQQFDNDVYDLFSPHISVCAKSSPGSTGKALVHAKISGQPQNQAN
jgi:argininosuccinate lyase